MASTNDITGDKLRSRINTESFEKNYERIFGKKKTKDEASYAEKRAVAERMNFDRIITGAPKRTVRYIGSVTFYGIGERAVLHPIDHDSPLVSNEHPIFTSPVISYDGATGRLETQNTIYEKAE